jgi:DNA adenine methylase
VGASHSRLAWKAATHYLGGSELPRTQVWTIRWGARVGTLARDFAYGEVMKIPHPIPYQGSKRNLAPDILGWFPELVATLIEPFAGSAAITLATAARGLAASYVINDLNKPLVDLWRAILESPERLARQYESLWRAQHGGRRQYYDQVRERFNRTGRPDYMLYLLARCVKASVRYNAIGEFNQSPDNRRMGALPETMREQILGASHLLRGRTRCSSVDYKQVAAQATTDDLIYMDPPYQGVCRERDPRYLKGVSPDEFAEVLESLNHRDIKYLVSYDGRTGDRVHGRLLPDRLRLHRIELNAGRSSQATLLGRADVTVESLYLSPALAESLHLRRGLILAAARSSWLSWRRSGEAPQTAGRVCANRIPFEVQGDVPRATPNPDDYMLLCGSANRAKSWSCEHCVNWLELKKPEICRNCYWAYPDNYAHVAMREARRADILWTGAEVESYEHLKRRTLQLQKNIPGYVKEIIARHLKSDPGA